MTYLSYSGWKTFDTCPCQYWHKYINFTVIAPENGANSLYGSTIGTVFERFYKEKVWRHKNYVERLQGMAESVLNEVIREQVRKGRTMDFSDERSNYPEAKTGNVSDDFRLGKQQIVKDVRAHIVNGVNTIREHKLVGPFMEAELKLDRNFGVHKMGGRADFTVTRVPPLNDRLILDGKGSRHREKYVDGQPRKKGEPVKGLQLKWYGVLHRDKYGAAPDRLGYIFWRFSGGEAVEWVPFTEQDLDLLKAEVLEAADRIARNNREIDSKFSPQAKLELREELFPTQVAFHCTLCAYSDVCDEGKKYVEGVNRRRKKSVLPQGTEELSLGVGD